MNSNLRSLVIVLSFFLSLYVSATERMVTQTDFSQRNFNDIISDTFNLEGHEIRIPADCTLTFKKNGCIKNGTIIFNNTKVLNPSFLDCKYEGNILIAGEIIDSTFCKNEKFDHDVLWWLIEQAANNSTNLELTKDYTICSSRIYSPPYAHNNRSYVIIENKSFGLKGNGHTIYDEHKHKGHFGKDFMVLVSCHDVVVESLYFEGLHNEINNIAVKGATQFPSPGGTNVILCLGDTRNIKISDGKCKHCLSYLWCGNDAKVEVDAENRNYYTDNLVVKGFENIDVEVDAFDTQYPIAIYKGRNIKVDLKFLYSRRGCRLQGVENADVKISGAFATTPVMLLLKDVISYTDETFSTRVYNACSNIKARIKRIEAIDTITKYKWYDIALNVGCYNCLDSLPTAKQFKDRDKAYVFKNIDVKYSCHQQQFAILLSRNLISHLNDVYEINLADCEGGGIEDSTIINPDSKLILNISKSHLNTVSMRFNDQDKISIFDSSIQSFMNKSNSHPEIKTIKSNITF